MPSGSRSLLTYAKLESPTSDVVDSGIDIQVVPQFRDMVDFCHEFSG